jgi:hypothetical protein
MAINIPILSSLNTKGFDQAKKEFAALNGAAAKSKYALQQAAVPAAAAFAAVTAGLGMAAKAAIEDQKQQALLAQQLRASTGATTAQIAAVEQYVTAASRAAAVSDEEIRPALAALARSTQDTAKAQELLTLALDISAATGRSAQSVSEALAKAYQGNLTALKRLGIPLDESITKTKDFDAAQKALSRTFGGAAATAAGTLEGRFKSFKISLDETVEAIGAGLLPVVEAVIRPLQAMARWAEDNPAVFRNMALAIAAVTGAVVALNIALNLNPIVAIASAIGVAVVALVGLYTKFEKFRVVVNTVVNAVIGYFERMINFWVSGINLFIKGLNLVEGVLSKVGLGFGKIAELQPVTLGRLATAFDTATTSAADFRKAEEANLKAYEDSKFAIDAEVDSLTDMGGAAGGATEKVKKTAKAVRDELTPAVKEAVESIRDRFSPALKQANDRLTDAQNAYNDFYSTVRGSVAGILDFGKAWDQATDPDNNTTFIDALTGQANAAESFAGDLETLISRGLDDPGLLNMILSAGTETGAAIAKALANGSADEIGTLQKLTDRVSAAADRIAKLTADKWYKAGVDQAQSVVDGINSVIAETEFNLKFVTSVAGAQIVGGNFDQAVAEVVSGGVSEYTNLAPGTAYDWAAGLSGIVQSASNLTTNNVSTRSMNVQILGGDPNSIVDQLRKYNRSNGPAPITTYG